MVFSSFRIGNPKRAFILNNSNISFWPLLQEDWYKSSIGITSAQNSLWFALFEKMLSEIPRQDIGLYLFEGQGWENAFRFLWRSNNHGALISVVHSSIRFWDLRYFYDLNLLNDDNFLRIRSDLVAVNGPYAKDVFINLGYSESDIFDVEALRYLELDKSLYEKKKIMLKDKKCNLLVLGDFIDGTTNEMMVTLGLIPKKILNKYRITVKPHPSTPILKENYPSLEFEITSEPLSDILSDYDVVFGANSTTATLDAYIFGLPVVVHIPYGDLITSPLKGMRNVIFVYNEHDTKRALEKNPEKIIHRKQDVFYMGKNLERWKEAINLIQNEQLKRKK
jgi:surface carbohydrate biosynthesis protein (TIGR04326 family)